METGTSIIAVAGLAGLVAILYSLLNYVKQLTSLPGSANAVVTMTLAYIGSIGLVFLYGASDTLGPTVVVSDVNLRTADTPAKILIGLGIAGVANVLYDRTLAKDNTQSAAVPTIIGSAPPAGD